MPTKTECRRWQDYTGIYRIARSKARAQHVPDSSRLVARDQSPLEQHAWAKTGSLTLYGFADVLRQPEYVIGDIQSDSPAVRSGGVDFLMASHHGETLAISLKSGGTGTIHETQRHLVDLGNLEPVGNWIVWPVLTTSRSYYGKFQPSGSVLYFQSAREFQRAAFSGQSWLLHGPQVMMGPDEIWGIFYGSAETAAKETRDAPEVVGDWVRSPDAILQRLRDSSLSDEERELTVLFAETIEFDEAQRAELLPLLHQYILDERFTEDEETQTSVGAAARKYAMNMDEPEFECYAELLKPSATKTLNYWIELELVKGVCWRLSYEVVEQKERFPNLTAALAEIASDYVTPRLVLQKNYASIALHAIVAVVILQALSGERDRAAQVFKQVSTVGVSWFSELLEDRIEDAIEAIAERDSQLAASVREIVGVAN